MTNLNFFTEEDINKKDFYFRGEKVLLTSISCNSNALLWKCLCVNVQFFTRGADFWVRNAPIEWIEFRDKSPYICGRHD